MIKAILMLALVLPLGNCATTCGGLEPINPSPKDRLTDGTAKQILTYNKAGAALGCFQAP